MKVSFRGMGSFLLGVLALSVFLGTAAQAAKRQQTLETRIKEIGSSSTGLILSLESGLPEVCAGTVGGWIYASSLASANGATVKADLPSILLLADALGERVRITISETDPGGFCNVDLAIKLKN